MALWYHVEWLSETSLTDSVVVVGLLRVVSSSGWQAFMAKSGTVVAGLTRLDQIGCELDEGNRLQRMPFLGYKAQRFQTLSATHDCGGSAKSAIVR